MTGPLGAREAALRILEDVRPQPPLRVPLDDALGSVLAEDVASPLDIPAWTNSAMDGYATRAADVRGASDATPVRLRVVEQIPAGHFPIRAIGPGECARIFTGAPLPEGADGVVRQEDTDGATDVVAILKDRDAGVNLRHAGEDVRRGASRAPAGRAARRRGARRARLARRGPPAGAPAAAGRHHGQRRRDRRRGPARGDPERPEDRQQQHPHPHRPGAPGRRRAGQPRRGARHPRELPRAPGRGAGGRPAGHHRRHQRGRARLRASGAGGDGRDPEVLEAADAARRAGGIRAPGRRALDRPARAIRSAPW